MILYRPNSVVITMLNDYIYNKNNKKHFQLNERRCRDVKTQKACKQG